MKLQWDSQAFSVKVHIKESYALRVIVSQSQLNSVVILQKQNKHVCDPIKLYL